MSNVLNLSAFCCHGNMIRMSGNVSFRMSEGKEPLTSIRNSLFGDVERLKKCVPTLHHQ